MNTERRPPIIDMTPDGQFRDPAPPGRFDRALTRIGGFAALIALGAAGIALTALLLASLAIIIPVMLIAGVIGGTTLWWRLRRARARGEVVRFSFIRR